MSYVPLCGPRQSAEAFRTEVSRVVEIDTDERIAAVVEFDLDDLDSRIRRA